MGRRAKQNGIDSRFCMCDVCGGDIVIDFYFDQGDMVCCDECSSEFIIHRSYPVKLLLFEEGFYGDYFDELDFS